LKLIELHAARRTKPCTVKQTHILQKPTDERIMRKEEYETSPEDACATVLGWGPRDLSSEQLNFIKPNSEVGNLTMRLLSERCNVTSG